MLTGAVPLHYQEFIMVDEEKMGPVLCVTVSALSLLVR